MTARRSDRSPSFMSTRTDFRSTDISRGLTGGGGRRNSSVTGCIGKSTSRPRYTKNTTIISTGARGRGKPSLCSQRVCPRLAALKSSDEFSVQSVLLHGKGFEHPGHADRESPRRIALGDACEKRRVTAHRAACDAGAYTKERSRVGADRRGVVGTRVEPAVDLADHLDAVGDGARDRHAIVQDVVLTIATYRIAENAEADVADDTHRLNSLPNREAEIEVRGVETKPAFIPLVRKPGEKPDSDCGPRFGFTREANLRADQRVWEVARRVAAEIHHEGKRTT